MHKHVKIIAFPGIPLIFLGGVHSDRRPIYNTMGLAVTDVNEEARSETVIGVIPNCSEITFLFEGKPLEGSKAKDTLDAVNEVLHLAGKKGLGLKIESRNFKIFSGSSDAGLSALVVGLDALLESKISKEVLARISMKGSESAIRSFVGGASEIVVDQPGPVVGKLVASADELKDWRVFALNFNYPSRFSADEIHAKIVTHPWYKHRVERIPEWVERIKSGLKEKNWAKAFDAAEENIRNAHYLLEDVGLRVRKKEMMNACITVEEMRAKGIVAYWLAGGGRLISVVTTKEFEKQVEKELRANGFDPVAYKVASGPKILELE